MNSDLVIGPLKDGFKESSGRLITILINFAFLGAGKRAEMDEPCPEELEALVYVGDKGAAPPQCTTEDRYVMRQVHL